MSKFNLVELLALLVVSSMALAACGGGATPTAEAGPKVTSAGFECPEPEPRQEVASTEVLLAQVHGHGPGG